MMTTRAIVPGRMTELSRQSIGLRRLRFKTKHSRSGGRHLPAASVSSIIFSKCISSLCSGLTSRILPFAEADG
jgi:hypothetical protein